MNRPAGFDSGYLDIKDLHSIYLHQHSSIKYFLRKEKYPSNCPKHAQTISKHIIVSQVAWKILAFCFITFQVMIK